MFGGIGWNDVDWAAWRGQPADLCIRCGEAPGADGLGYCGHCHWASHAEVEEGLFLIGRYLESWARFAEWCSANGLPS